MLTWKKGVSVICIDDSFEDFPDNPFRASNLNLPKKGEIYTVRSVVDTNYGPGIRLREIENKELYSEEISGYQEPSFRIGRFELVTPS